MQHIHDEVTTILKQTPAKDVLLAFDIDLTLTQPDFPAAYYPVIKKFPVAFKQIIADLSTEQIDAMLTLATESSQRLVRNDTATIVKSLQSKDIKTIAFTASLAGKLGQHSRFEMIRYKNLRELDLNFESSFQEHSDFVLVDCDAYRDHYPVFYRGILCSNGERGNTSKGKTLIAFLKHINYSPKVVVMVDDKMSNLEDIEKYLQIHHPQTKFVGFEYLDALENVSEFGDISEEEFKNFWQDLASKAKSA